MDPRSLTPEFKEFLQCLNAQRAEYLVIGGHAVAYHGYPRATQDMDVWIAVSEANANKTLAALKAFGFDVPGLSVDLFLQADRVIRMGVSPNRIEILTGVDGVQFDECYRRHLEIEIDGVPVNLITLDDLKRNKKASGRNKDLADLDNLP